VQPWIDDYNSNYGRYWWDRPGGRPAVGRGGSQSALNILTIRYARAFPSPRLVSATTPGLTATDFMGVREGRPAIEELRAAGIQGNDGPVPW
jgi:hypothetical protein